MGIRGAWSLLLNDPRRFGRPWHLRDEVIKREKSTCVFVDGPSLLYHVAVSDVYDQSPPITHAHINEPGSVHQASPATIYARATSFIKALLVVCGGDVHVALDGLAPIEKIHTQVNRLRTMAHQGEASATASNSQCKLLHLLAEQAMVEAIEDLMKEQSRLCLHRPDHGEAEAYIDGWIQCHSSSTEEVFIFSDDTDFLVYSSCPGFIPFKTLEFQILDGHLCLTGFQYHRSEFLQAFFPMAEERVMTTVAALAGCDYGNSHSLERARTHIVQSNIGGLRHRQRNDPSAAAALTAILRYVAHFLPKPSWQNILAESVCKDPEARILLLTCLQEIHDIYFPGEANIANVNAPMSVECRRLFEWGIMFCRPLIETWEGGDTVTTKSRSRKRKSRKNRRKKRPAVQKDSRENESVNDLILATFVPFPPSNSFAAQHLATGGAWSVFSQVRRRLYTVVRQYAHSQEDRRIRFHPTWTSSDTVVKEYIRIGRGAHVDFVPKQIIIPMQETSNVAATSIPLDAGIEWIINEEQLMVLKPLLEEGGVLILASFMLPATSALLLFLLAKAPPLASGCTVKATFPAKLRESLLFISIALFHARLMENVMAAFSISEARSTDLPLKRIQVSRILRHDLAAGIWVQMENIVDIDIIEDKNGDVSCLHALFFDKLKVATMKRLPVSAHELLAWRNDTEQLWITWCQISRNQYGCLS